jgi:hypothetical protein
MLKILYEHNTLNGFRLVLIEFTLVAVVALFIGVATYLQGRALWTVASLGVAINAAAVCGTVVEQMRRGERSSSLAESSSREGRQRIRREHPHLALHTVQIVGAVLIPFLLAILTIIDRASKPGGRISESE